MHEHKHVNVYIMCVHTIHVYEQAIDLLTSAHEIPVFESVGRDAATAEEEPTGWTRFKDSDPDEMCTNAGDVYMSIPNAKQVSDVSCIYVHTYKCASMIVHLERLRVCVFVCVCVYIYIYMKFIHTCIHRYRHLMIFNNKEKDKCNRGLLRNSCNT